METKTNQDFYLIKKKKKISQKKLDCFDVLFRGAEAEALFMSKKMETKPVEVM